MTRPVTVFKWYRPEDAKCNDPYTKEIIGTGQFHQFGCDYDHLDAVGNFSTAIVEMPDGTIKNVPLDMVRFDDI